MASALPVSSLRTLPANDEDCGDDTCTPDESSSLSPSSHACAAASSDAASLLGRSGRSSKLSIAARSRRVEGGSLTSSELLRGESGGDAGFPVVAGSAGRTGKSQSSSSSMISYRSMCRGGRKLTSCYITNHSESFRNPLVPLHAFTKAEPSRAHI